MKYAPGTNLPARHYDVLFSWCISRNLPTQCCRTFLGILQNTMALFSMLSTFSEILTCRSSSSSENSWKKMSSACSRHRGAARVLRASRSSSIKGSWALDAACCIWLPPTVGVTEGTAVDGTRRSCPLVRRRFSDGSTLLEGAAADPPNVDAVPANGGDPVESGCLLFRPS